jgi:hypothetical protein
MPSGDGNIEVYNPFSFQSTHTLFFDIYSIATTYSTVYISALLAIFKNTALQQPTIF